MNTKQPNKQVSNSSGSSSSNNNNNNNNNSKQINNNLIITAKNSQTALSADMFRRVFAPFIISFVMPLLPDSMQAIRSHREISMT